MGDQDKEATHCRRRRDCRPTSWQSHNQCFTGEEKSGGAKRRQDKDEAWAVISHIQTESFTVFTAVESDLSSADDLRWQFNRQTPEKCLQVRLLFIHEVKLWASVCRESILLRCLNEGRRQNTKVSGRIQTSGGSLGYR